MAKIEVATQEQWDAVERLRESWIARQTQQSDYNDVRDAVVGWYELAGHAPPQLIVVAKSPLATIWCDLLLRNQDDGDSLGDSLWASLGDSLWASLGDSLWDSLRYSLRASLRDSLWDSLRDSLWDSLWDSLRDSLRASLGDSLRASLGDSLRDSLWASLRDSLWDSLRDSVMNYQQCYAAFIEGGELLGVSYDKHKYQQYLDINNHCPHWIVPRSQTCVVCARPVFIGWENNVLHCDDGPSVQFEDGLSSVYSLGGVMVDEQIVMRPETQTIDQIKQEGNEEVRRVRIERFGWDRYLRETGAKKVDSRRNDRDTQDEELRRLDDGTQRFLCVDPSTGRKYALGVPREIATCEQAQNWMSHGLDKLATHRS